MIGHSEFEALRLSEFVGGVVELECWQFMGRQWVGEAVGFSEWLRPDDDPTRLGSLALDFADLPSGDVEAILARLDLRLRPGMTLRDVVTELGTPARIEQFVPDRSSYEFNVTAPDRYTVSCTIHDNDGLIYLVVSTAVA